MSAELSLVTAAQWGWPMTLWHSLAVMPVGHYGDWTTAACNVGEPHGHDGQKKPEPRVNILSTFLACSSTGQTTLVTNQNNGFIYEGRGLESLRKRWKYAHSHVYLCICVTIHWLKYLICFTAYMFKKLERKGVSTGLEKNSRIGRSHKGHWVHLHLRGSAPKRMSLLGIPTPRMSSSDQYKAFPCNEPPPQPIPMAFLSSGPHCTPLGTERQYAPLLSTVPSVIRRIVWWQLWFISALKILEFCIFISLHFFHLPLSLHFCWTFVMLQLYVNLSRSPACRFLPRIWSLNVGQSV